MQSNPYVSVVIPAYNAEATIAQTISSVLAQTFKDFEIVVVNDGSIDRTASFVNHLSATDPRITLVSQHNTGVAAARNCGISSARSELIAPLDADDLWHATYLEKQIKTLDQNMNTVLVYAWSRYIDSDGNITWTPYYRVVEGRVFARQLYWNIVGNGSAMILRKSVALEFGGYDSRVVPTEDLMLQLKVASRYSIAVTREYLVGYRQHTRQESTNADRSYQSWVRTLQIVRAECEAVPGQAIAWKLGELHFDAAVRASSEGQFREALRLISLAARSDPAGVALMLAVLGKQRARGLAGRLKRAVVPIHAPAERSPFLESRPDEVAPPRKLGLRERRRERRLDYLQQLDETAGPGKGRPQSEPDHGDLDS
jgi:glycosyltransferase involved in cell wall biosynthesis